MDFVDTPASALRDGDVLVAPADNTATVVGNPSRVSDTLTVLLRTDSGDLDVLTARSDMNFRRAAR